SICSFQLRLPPLFTPFPYTTLFRSSAAACEDAVAVVASRDRVRAHGQRGRGEGSRGYAASRADVHRAAGVAAVDLELDRQHDWRSEEHTSELQSQSNLVCRLLLEKK